MLYNDGRSGFLTAIVGPMFSEKSGELIKRCRQAEQYQGKKVAVYKPQVDTRFSQNEVVSRIGLRMEAYSLRKEISFAIQQEVLRQCEEADVIAFDEVQFFSRRIVEIAKALLQHQKHVMVAGLNLDYLGRPFGAVGELLLYADEILVKNAFCKCCGRPAMHTQRLIDGKPDTGQSRELVLIGDTESYEPRCRLCFVPPERQEPIT